MNPKETAKADKRTCSLLDALSIGQAVRRGEAVLLGPVVFHRETVRVTVHWKPLRRTAEEVLQWNRSWLEALMRRSLEKMERMSLDEMPEAEVERLCEKYGRYQMILEVSG